MTLDVKILMFHNLVVINIVVWRMKTFDGLMVRVVGVWTMEWLGGRVVVGCGQWRCGVDSGVVRWAGCCVGVDSGDD